MTASLNTTQGEKLSLAIESALGTPGSYTDIHFNDGLEIPTATRSAYMQPRGGRTNPADYPKVIDYEVYQEGAITLPVMPRRHTSTGNPPIVSLLESSGWSTAKLSAAGVTDTGTAADAIVWDNDDGCEDGSMALVEVTSGYYVPVHIAAWTVGTKTGVPTMDLEANPGTGKVIQQMFTCSPRTGQVTTTKTTALRFLSRAEDGSSNPQQWTFTGCSFNLGEITINPNEVPEFPFTGTTADIDISDGTWAAETFIDQEELNLTGGDFEFRIAQGDASSGGITRAVSQLLTATITPNVNTQVIKTVGDDGGVNGCNGYLARFAEQPRISVTGIFNIDFWEDFETSYTGGSGTNPATMIEFAWPTRDLDIPALLISCPDCSLVEAPTAAVRDTENGFVTGTLVFGATACGLGGEDGPTSAGDQAIYIGISGEES